MKLSPAIHQFFDQYLPHIKGVSEHTLKAYRDAFKLFLIFAADYYGIKIKSLRLEQITSELILAFLDDLQAQRRNKARTRNQRLAALKSFAKMIRLLYPQHREVAETIFSVPQKRTQKTLVGFLYPEEILNLFHAVNLKRKEGFRDYTLLHLLFDSGARASEVATLNLDYLNLEQKTLAILGKGNRFRLIELEPKTTQLLQLYISRFRPPPKPPFEQRLFVNQRGEELTRHGIYRLCRKYLTTAKYKGKTPNGIHVLWLESIAEAQICWISFARFFRYPLNDSSGARCKAPTHPGPTSFDFREKHYCRIRNSASSARLCWVRGNK